MICWLAWMGLICPSLRVGVNRCSFKDEEWGGSRQEELPARGSELLAKEMKCRKGKEEKASEKIWRLGGGYRKVDSRLGC